MCVDRAAYYAIGQRSATCRCEATSYNIEESNPGNVSNNSRMSANEEQTDGKHLVSLLTKRLGFSFLNDKSSTSTRTSDGIITELRFVTSAGHECSTGAILGHIWDVIVVIRI